MRIEFRVEGRLVTVEAEGAVSIRVSDDEGAGRLGADMATRIQGLRKGNSEEACMPEADVAIPVEEPVSPVPCAEDMEGMPGAADSVQMETDSVQVATGAEAAAPEHGVLLMERLVGLRRKLAAAEGVPTYVIFHDKALHQMVEKLPQDLEAFRSISGVGKTRLEKYGDMFLAAIREGMAA
jgi:superfamily II DNA helicase RecQ